MKNEWYCRKEIQWRLAEIVYMKVSCIFHEECPMLVIQRYPNLELLPRQKFLRQKKKHLTELKLIIVKSNFKYSYFGAIFIASIWQAGLFNTKINPAFTAKCLLLDISLVWLPYAPCHKKKHILIQELLVRIVVFLTLMWLQLLCITWLFEKKIQP